jgi:putative MATE family efflux protein
MRVKTERLTPARGRLADMKDLTQGSIVGHISTMAPQIFAGMIMIMFCQLIDLYFVSALGDAAIAGVGAAGNAGFLINALTQVLSVGTVALISHAAGRRDRADANLVFNQSLGLSAVCGIATLVAGLVLARSYMRSVAADIAVVEAGTTYLLWFMPALALQFAILVMASALRGTGLVRPTMVVQTMTVVINIILAPVLITGWGTGRGLGVAGAGLASSIAIALGVVMMWIYFHRSEHYVAIDREMLRPQIAQWKRILNIGLPAGGEFAVLFVSMAVIYYALGHFGAAAQAGFGIGSRLLGVVHMPVISIAFAAGAIAGQNLGAGNRERVKETFKSVVVLGTAVMVAFTIFAQWRPELWLGGFTRDPETIAVGALFLRMISLKHVSGTGQHQAGAAELRRAPDHLWSAAAMAVRKARFSHRAGLVPVDCDDHAAGGVEPVVVAPGVPEAAGAAAGMKPLCHVAKRRRRIYTFSDRRSNRGGICMISSFSQIERPRPMPVPDIGSDL